MSLPREVIPGRFYMIPRRCTQRQFLLRPDEETSDAFLSCLADAAQRFDITVLLTCAMSNHHPTVIFDRHGHVPAFTERFHKLLAKSQNALRGRWGKLWACRAPWIATTRVSVRADATAAARWRSRIHGMPGLYSNAVDLPAIMW